MLRIAAARETLTFELEDTYAALGKLKQCVDSARIRLAPSPNPLGDGSSGGDPGRPGGSAPDRDFIDAIAGVLAASGLESLQFVDPASAGYDNAVLAWADEDVNGALFFLDEDASGAADFTKAFIGGVASACTGTFGSQTKPGSRAGRANVSEFSMACEEEDGSEFMAATVLATSEGTLIFVHFTTNDPGRLRALNDDLRRVIGIIWGS